MSEERLIDGTKYVVEEIAGKGACLVPVPVPKQFKITYEDGGRIFRSEFGLRMVLFSCDLVILLGVTNKIIGVMNEYNNCEDATAFYDRGSWCYDLTWRDLA